MKFFHLLSLTRPLEVRAPRSSARAPSRSRLAPAARAPASCTLRVSALLLALGSCSLGCDSQEPQGTLPSSPIEAAEHPSANDSADLKVSNEAATRASAAKQKSTQSEEGEQPEPSEQAERPEEAEDSEQEFSSPRLYAKSRFVWIRGQPTSEVQWIGYLWAGGSVALRDAAAVSGRGCRGKWVPVEPRGYICADGDAATLDENDTDFLLLQAHRPRVESAFPHHYAEIHHPLRRYRELDAAIGAPRLENWPRGLYEGKTKMVARSAFAFSRAYGASERYLLASDLSWVKESDVKLLPQSEFRGVQLAESKSLPLAFFPTAGRFLYQLAENGEFVESKDELPWHDTLALSGVIKKVDKDTYYKLAEGNSWVRGRDAVIPEPQANTPWGDAVDFTPFSELPRESQASQPQQAQAASKRNPQERRSWLEISVLGGWLIAYEDTRPVFATMISAGRGGTPHPGKKPVQTASTPTGRFSVNGKFRTATMESSTTPIVHADVPWTQNFSGPHAIHSAYWHDNFGKLMSAGCVNVSPLDGKWLFEFSEPQAPQDWHGVRYVPGQNQTTLVIVHR